MITKADAKLLNEIVERGLIVNVRNDDMTLVAVNVQIKAIVSGKQYAVTIEHGPASIAVVFTRLKGHSRLRDGGLLLMI